MKTKPKPRTKPALHVYKVEDGETHWYVASSPRDALKQLVHDYTFPVQTAAQWLKENERPAISMLLDDEKLTINMEDEKGDYKPLTDTCAEWAKSGRMCIATTNI